MTRKRTKAGARINEVAAAAGVSVMSVSRAMRGVEGVSAATRDRIIEVARQLKYVPNSSARALSVANADLIGISLPTFANDVFGDVLSGMRGTFEQAGYSSVIDTTEYDPDMELAWAERLLAWRPAAMILSGLDHHPALVTRLRERRVPTLEIWDHAPDPIDICVGIDHRAAGALIGEHVAELGYKRPAYVGAPPGRDRRADARVAGLRDVFGPLGRKLIVQGESDPNAFAAGALGTTRVLEHAPDVIFYLNDNMAFGGMMICQQQGLDVPGDIGVAGYNALGITRVLPVQMTTVRTPRRAMGRVGARHLLARIKGVRPERSVALPVTIVEGATTRLQSR